MNAVNYRRNGIACIAPRSAATRRPKAATRRGRAHQAAQWLHTAGLRSTGTAT